MLAQPDHEGRSRAIGQEIDRLMLFDVAPECSVDPPFLEGEIINTQHAWGQRSERFSLADNPQQGIVAHAHAELVASLAPAFPPSAVATLWTVRVSRMVRWARTGSSSGDRAANVRWVQAGLSQKKRLVGKHARMSRSAAAHNSGIVEAQKNRVRKRIPRRLMCR